MTSTRDTLISALEAGDEVTIRRLNWAPVLEAASTWWAPKQRCSFAEFVSYAKLLGDYDPAEVLEAFAELAGEWRPHPAAVRGQLNKRNERELRTDVGRSRDRSRSTDALDAVRAALAAGERTCDCPGPCGRKWVPDAVETRRGKDGRTISLPVGVWRCPDCVGIEPGQVYAANEASLEQLEPRAAA